MATLQCSCNSLALIKPCCPRRRGPLLQPFSSSTRFVSSTSLCTRSSASTSRWGCVVSAVVAEENAVGSAFSAAEVFKLTYLEVTFATCVDTDKKKKEKLEKLENLCENDFRCVVCLQPGRMVCLLYHYGSQVRDKAVPSLIRIGWLWNVGGTNILVDPILVGNLDFGIPWLYDAAKKVLKQFQLIDLPEINCLLITQSLDDHCHLKTLKPFSQKFPNIRVIATPNAKSLLDPLFRNVTYLEPGQSSDIETNYGSKVNVKATAGPVLGPPWQRPENGYLVTSPQGQLSLYYEPHCVYSQSYIEKEKADIVITPVIKQLLPNFTLVSGQEDAVKLAKLLQAKFIVPMKNGDLDSKGLLASLVRGEGTVESFKELLSKELPDAKVVEPTPGVPVEIAAN